MNLMCRKNSLDPYKKPGILFRIYPLAGLASLAWILLRVITKPSRAQYPCVKAAAPMASGFILYVAGLFAAGVSFRKMAVFARNRQPLLAGLLFILGFSAGMFAVLKTWDRSYADVRIAYEDFVPIDPPNTPMGLPIGIRPGRVVWDWDSSAANWDGKTGYWWEDRFNSQEKVDAMLSRSLKALTGESTDAEAWDVLFRYHNQERRGKGGMGYQAGEKIAVKFNLVDVTDSGNPRNTSFPSPHVVLALLRQLVNEAGVAAGDVTFYDTGKYVPDAIYLKCKAEFPDVHFMGRSKLNGREKFVRDTDWIMQWSEELTLEIGGGHPAYLPTAVTQAEYLINLASFKAHRYVGVTSCAKNHFGTISCDNDNGSESSNAPKSAGLHPYVTVNSIYFSGSPEWSFEQRPMGTYNALVDLMGHSQLGGKTLLFMADAMYATQTEHDKVAPASRWLMSPFNNDWTSSLFLSQDEVALESVSVDFFRYENRINSNMEVVAGTVDNYLHEAAQAGNPPSGTVYDPEGDGAPLQSLGVHEHWNNPEDKQYSRNLGTGEGIELFRGHDATSIQQRSGLPSGFILNQNFPNPFNGATRLTYALDVPADVEIAVFNPAGRRIRTLFMGPVQSGFHQSDWDGLDEIGNPAPSGIYIARVTMENSGGRQMRAVKMAMQK
jgi:hypothetical protein